MDRAAARTVRKIFFFSMAKKILFTPWAPSRAVRLGMDEIQSCRPETVVKDMAAAKAMDLEEVAQHLRIPTLILCGSRDTLTPVALSRRLNDLIPGSRLHVVEGSAHMLPLEAPEQVNREILDFVRSVVESEPGGGVSMRSMLRRLLRKARTLFRRDWTGEPAAWLRQAALRLDIGGQITIMGVFG